GPGQGTRTGDRLLAVLIFLVEAVRVGEWILRAGERSVTGGASRIGEDHHTENVLGVDDAVPAVLAGLLMPDLHRDAAHHIGALAVADDGELRVRAGRRDLRHHLLGIGDTGIDGVFVAGHIRRVGDVDRGVGAL